MLINLIRGGDTLTIFMGICVSAFVVFCVMPIHEYAHAFVATKLGDDTARLSGRLTLNPMAHINPLGAIMILLVGFGYAKPVPVNVRNTKLKNKACNGSCRFCRAAFKPDNCFFVSFVEICCPQYRR